MKGGTGGTEYRGGGGTVEVGGIMVMTTAMDRLPATHHGYLL